MCVYATVLLMITRGMELSAVMVGWGGRGWNGFDGWLGGSAGARVKISSRTTPYITSQLQEKKWERKCRGKSSDSWKIKSKYFLYLVHPMTSRRLAE